MRGLLVPLGILLLVVATGCLDGGTKTILKLDGSGTYTEVVTIDTAKATAYRLALEKQMALLDPAPGAGGEDPYADLDTKARAAALKLRKGITVTRRHESADAEKKTRTFELDVAFENLKAFYEAGVVDDVAVKLEPSKDGKRWTLTIRHVFDGNVREPEDAAAAEQLTRLRRSMLARYKTWWGSLSVVRTLTLPTQVLSTNGTKSADGRSVTWKIGFDDLPDPRRLRQVVTFAHDEKLKLEAFELTTNDIANAKELAELEAEEKKAGGK